MVTLPLEEVPLVKECGSIEGTLEGSMAFLETTWGPWANQLNWGRWRENSFIFCKMDYLTRLGF